MAKENMESFIKKFNEDKQFAVSVIRAESTQAVLRLAREKGIEISEGDLNNMKPMLQKALAAAQKQAGELSENQLDSVAGGVGDINITNNFDIDVNVTVDPSLLGPGGQIVDTIGGLTGGTGGTPSIPSVGGTGGTGGIPGTGGLGGWLR